MATTRIIPLHTGKGRTVGKAISDIIDYLGVPMSADILTPALSRNMQAV